MREKFVLTGEAISFIFSPFDFLTSWTEKEVLQCCEGFADMLQEGTEDAKTILPKLAILSSLNSSGSNACEYAITKLIIDCARQSHIFKDEAIQTIKLLYLRWMHRPELKAEHAKMAKAISEIEQM